MGNLARRLSALELHLPEGHSPHSTEAGRKLIEWLEGYCVRKRADTLTARDEARAEEIHKALKRHRELSRGEGGR